MPIVTKGLVARELLARAAHRVGHLGLEAALGLHTGAERLTRAEATLAQASNRARLLAWAAHRRSVDCGGPTVGFSPDATHKLLLVSVDDPICHSQVFPFYYYQPELARQLGMQVREVSLKRFEAQARLAGLADVDTVCLQTWFDRTPDQLSALVAKIRAQSPRARVVYLDWFAPTDLRLAETLHSQVDLYVKKHVFRERHEYTRATYGDTNLMDFYGKLYGLQHETQRFHVPTDFYARLVVGPSFATADYMLPRLLYGPEPSLAEPRPIDLHARISFQGTPWYERMRREAVSALDGLSDLEVMTGTGIKRRAYLRELSASKLCFSPFGYGEVCWRDYEAAMCGSLLLKPDMSHVETHPDIFRAGETYVPLRWDFADLGEKVRHYMAHPAERARITSNAFAALQTYFRGQGFLEHVRTILEPTTPARRVGADRVSGMQLRMGAQMSRRPDSASA